MDYPKATIELSLVSQDYPDVYSKIDITIVGRKQTADQVYKLLSEKFVIVDNKTGGE